jgi:hypothetical protein
VEPAAGEADDAGTEVIPLAKLEVLLHHASKKSMKSLLSRLFCLGLLCVSSSCGWKPQVDPAPITEPWASMDLPVKEDAVVWGSTPTEFKAVHKDGRPLVSSAYALALTKLGWSQTKKEMGDIDYYYFEKSGETLEVQLYDFHNTGVIIRKK